MTPQNQAFYKTVPPQTPPTPPERNKRTVPSMNIAKEELRGEPWKQFWDRLRAVSLFLVRRAKRARHANDHTRRARVYYPY